MTEQTEQLRVDLADARRVALFYLRMATKRKKELAKLRKQASVRVQKCGYCDYQYSTGTNAENFAVMAEHIKSCPKHPLAKALAELAQARGELKDLRGANSALVRRVASVAENRDFWYKMTWAAEAERDQIRKEAQEQSDEVQEHWLSPVEAEGLRRQLKHTEGERDYWVKAHDELEMQRDNAATGEAAIVEAAEALLGQLLPIVSFNKDAWMACGKEFRQLRDTLGYRSEAAAKLLERLAEAEAKLTRAHWLSPDEAAAVSEWTRWGKEEHSHVQERLATLDAAEAALGGCGLTGIYDEFGGLADAIQQMVKRLEQLEGEPVEVEITGKEMVEALQAEVRKRREAELAAHVHDKAADELVQTLHTERQLRREAEQRAEGALATARKRATRMGEAERRANKAVNQLSRAGEREHQANQRAERAEALAALVNEEMADLLERLADTIDKFRTLGFSQIVYTARITAARIREALDEQ